MLKQILLLSQLVFTLVLAVALFRASFLYKPLPQPKPCNETHERIKLNHAILKRFKGALDIKTISYEQHKYETSELLRLIDFIESSFPLIHKANFVQRELISNYTLLYTIEGSNKSLRPYVLTAHLDVVPTVREKWSNDPFDAVIKEDKHIYARGAIDVKDLLMSMLEALEHMIKKQFKPERSFYLVFGHDEELGGLEGAASVAELLSRRLKESKWNQLEYVLDEGNIISKTRFPGVDADIGLIGVVEKGYLTVKVSTVGTVGHGSMPPSMTSIAKLSTAVSKFHSHLFPSYFGEGVEKDMLETMATYATWPYKFVYANFWLFKPIFQFIFSSDPTLNSLIRTSTAVTMINGGTKENVLPDSASAFINHRIHPKETIRDVIEFDKKIIDDPTITIEVPGHKKEPTPVSLYCDDCYGYQLVKKSVLQIYPGTVIVPSTFLAASDSRWYVNLTDSIYRFSAIAVPLDEMKRFHGHDERISLENYENLINFYHHLIVNSDGPQPSVHKSERRDEL